MAVDYFLEISDIKGESIDKDHKDQIQISSFSWGAGAQTTRGTGGGLAAGGKPSYSDFQFSKHLDMATPKLLDAMSKGTHIPKVTLYAIKNGAGGGEFLKVEFEVVMITSIAEGAADEVPQESVSFTYNKVTLTYSKQDDKGKLQKAGTHTYDISANKTA